MSLRSKMLFLVAIIIAGLFIFQRLALNAIVLDGFTNLEEQDTKNKLEQAASTLTREMYNLKDVNTDWAKRNDTYSFMQDSNENYIKANLIDNVFINNHLSLMIYLNTGNVAIFQKAYDLNRNVQIDVPVSLQPHLSQDSPLLDTGNNEYGYVGILALPEGPMMIAAHSIFNSEGIGPSRGTLIFGRYIDSAEIQLLAETLRLSLSLHSMNQIQIPADFNQAQQHLSGESLIYINTIDEDSIAGYTVIQDIYAKPAMLLKTESPRTIYRQGQTTMLYFTITSIIVGLIWFIAAFILIERFFLSRISGLSKNVSRIGKHADISARISSSGKDELSSLAGDINKMLENLEQAKANQKESEEFNSSLLNNAPNPILVRHPDHSIKFVNPALEKLTGFSSQEVVGTIAPYPWWPGKKEQQYYSELNDIDTTEETKHERLLKNKNGDLFWVEVITSVIKENEKVKYYLSNWVDITESKQSKESLNVLYEEEKELRKKLEFEIKKRVEFTRALVHELKTPITPVMASSELLVEELKEKPLLSLAKNINQGAINLNKRINELLDLARGEIGTLKLNTQPLDVLKLIKDILSYTLPMVSGNNLSLSTELPFSLPTISADEERLRQVLLNLIDNAVKYTPENGRIVIRAREEYSNIIIEVEDTGRGLNEEEQQRLFQPYSRMVGDSERFSGLGLGLALAKTIVELHSGKIWVKSQKGKGSTFTFSLPVKSEVSTEK